VKWGNPGSGHDRVGRAPAYLVHEHVTVTVVAGDEACKRPDVLQA
jgi:hypothetical protein